MVTIQDTTSCGGLPGERITVWLVGWECQHNLEEMDGEARTAVDRFHVIGRPTSFTCANVGT